MRLSRLLIAALLALSPSLSLAQGRVAPIPLPSGSTGPADGLTVTTPSGDARTLAARWAEQANVRDYGAKCDGVTDDSPAVARALANYRVAFLPVAGCAGQYLINSTVTVPASKGVLGQLQGSTAGTGAGSILTTTSVDTFQTGGGGTAFERLSIVHNGASGSAIRNAVGTLMRVRDSRFDATNTSSTSPVIYTAGSSAAVEFNIINNNRASSAYAIDIDRTTAGGISIETYFTRNQISGSGSGFIVHTSDGSKRPEGVHLYSNTVLTKGDYQLYVNAVLSLNAIGNTFDLAASRAVVFDPVDEGIDTVVLTGNWFANESSGNYGPCLEFSRQSNLANNASSGILNVAVSANHFHFCTSGILAANSLSGISINANDFTSIKTYGINIDQSYRVTITGNTMQNLGGGNYIYMADGILGGPFVVTGNILSGGISGVNGIVTNRTTQSKFIIANNAGVGNVVPDVPYRVALTTAGTTVPAGAGVVQLTQGATIASATITLPTATYNLQEIKIENYAGAITAASFSPAVTNFTNGSTVPAYGRLLLRWDSTLAAWVRFLPQ